MILMERIGSATDRGEGDGATDLSLSCSKGGQKIDACVCKDPPRLEVRSTEIIYSAVSSIVDPLPFTELGVREERMRMAVLALLLETTLFREAIYDD